MTIKILPIAVVLLALAHIPTVNAGETDKAPGPQIEGAILEHLATLVIQQREAINRPPAAVVDASLLERGEVHAQIEALQRAQEESQEQLDSLERRSAVAYEVLRNALAAQSPAAAPGGGVRASATRAEVGPGRPPSKGRSAPHDGPIWSPSQQN